MKAISLLNAFHEEGACKNLIGSQDYFSVLMRHLPLKFIISKVEGFILLYTGNEYIILC